MSEPRKGQAKTITMDPGTAYDLFASLYVLHMPKKFGVRGAWASGMLARLSSESRQALSESQPVIGVPVHLVATLPQPKDVETLLWHLAQWDPIDRVQKLSCPWELEACGCPALLREVADRGRWTPDDREQLAEMWRGEHGAEKSIPEEKLDRTLDFWVNASRLGETYLAALRNYHEVFFAEEEERIRPVITAAAERIAKLAKKLAVSDLIEEISGGVRLETEPTANELVLAPSYWVSPLMIRMLLDADRMLIVFGARLSTDSIVPGETVPDGLIRALKALSDPTRLRILRLVAEEPLGAAELARSLRLRTPTVLHHIHALRLSGLIRIRVPEKDSKLKSLISLRSGAVNDVMTALQEFLHREGTT